MSTADMTWVIKELLNASKVLIICATFFGLAVGFLVGWAGGFRLGLRVRC